MKGLLLKISVITVVIVFLGVMFVSFALVNSSHSNSLLKNSVKGNETPIYQSANSDPSVHLYVNGNGYVVFSANYTVDGILHFNFDSDRSENLSTNDVPSGTVFHLVSSPNSGYSFQKWTGSVNSTNNSIYLTVNENINEEAIYAKTSYFPVYFTQSGLPAGTIWYVNISGQPSSGPITQNSYNVSLQNGTYNYSISTTDKDYAPNIYSGSVTVADSSVSVPLIEFSLQTYKLSFIEEGLPLGTWYVNLSGGQHGNAAAGSQITFSLPNGTYSYDVATSNKEYHTSSITGTLDMAGSTSLKIVFIQTTYGVQFTESGLLTGTTWFVNLTNGMDSGPVSGTSYAFLLSNKTYSYTIATTDKTYESSAFSGSFTVNGKPVLEPIEFSKLTYSVTFAELGLPSGTSWILVFNQNTYILTNTSYTFQEPNGTYSYSAGSHDYKNLSGTVTVNGVGKSKSLNFILQTYSVIFTETGLHTGSTWYANITETNRTTYDSGSISAISYSFYLTNGTYSYTLATSNKTYEPSPSSGSLTVNGDSASKSVAFSEVKYTVTLTESGLPSGTIWYVNSTNGQTFSFASSTGSFTEPNGTYSYTVATSDKTYESFPSSGSFTMDGKNISQSVTFSEVKYSVTFTEYGLPSGTSWSVTHNGTIESSTTNTITFSLPNGTYSYTIGAISGYSVSPSSGSISVTGSNVSKAVTYTAMSIPPAKTHPSGLSNTDIYGIIGSVVALATIGFAVVLMRKRK